MLNNNECSKKRIKLDELKKTPCLLVFPTLDNQTLGDSTLVITELFEHPLLGAK